MHMKKNLGTAVTAFLCVVLALALLFQQRRMETLEQAAQEYNALRNECDELRMEFDSVKADLRESLEREMELEAELRTRPTAGGRAAAYAVDVEGVDLAERTVTLAVSVDLAAADENARASVVTDTADHHDALETPLTRGEDGRYTGSIILPLEPDDRVQMRLLTTVGGSRYSEALCVHHSLMELLPVQLRQWSGDVEYADGKLIFSGWTFRPEDVQGGPAEIEEAALELSQDGAPLLAFGLTEEADAYVQTPDSFSVNCGEGEAITVSFTCMDQYGLRYVFSAGWWEVKNGAAVRHWPSAARPDLRWE